jgi:Holliday junction resolvase-like predicted endonuclease
LFDRAGDRTVTLSAPDYQAIAGLVGIINVDPGVELRRHHLLAMYRPLRIFTRIPAHRWGQVQLTPAGCDLATEADTAAVFEGILRDIRFAIEPWATSGRAEEYAEFDVPVYEATLAVLEQCDGFIDRNEFDFFVSRIRWEAEIGWAVNAIAEYRELSNPDQESLHREVQSRIPADATGKKYQNWRDVGLHTFSLFGVGKSMVRDGQRLLLVGTWAAPAPAPARRRGSDRRVAPQTPALRLPDTPEDDELLVPPAAAEANDGTDAEALVAKALQSQGWTVAFYTNRRGYGFDLWARKDRQAMLVVVKSSTGTLGSISLTATEHRAAQQHGAHYVLALVEQLGSDAPRIYMLADPANSLEIRERQATDYTIARRTWTQALRGQGPR